MSNDAKLGLVLGVAIVLVIGLVFFRGDSLTATVPAKAAASAPFSKDAPQKADALVRANAVSQ